MITIFDPPFRNFRTEVTTVHLTLEGHLGGKVRIKTVKFSISEKSTKIGAVILMVLTFTK
jgi:hypothetical protein